MSSISENEKKEQNTLVDDTNDHKYFTIIPNIVFELGLSAQEIAVYCFIKKVAGENGACFMGVRRICKTLQLTNKTLKKIKETLIQKNLISVEIRPKKEGGQHITTILDIWPENMSHFKKPMGVGKELQGCSPDPTGGCSKRTTKEELSIKEEHINKNNTSSPIGAKAPSFLLLSSKKNVKLTPSQIEKLKKKLGPDYEQGLEIFSAWLDRSGESRRSHYMSILNWVPEEIKNRKKRVLRKDQTAVEKENNFKSNKALLERFAVWRSARIFDPIVANGIKNLEMCYIDRTKNIQINYNQPTEEVIKTIKEKYGINVNEIK